MPSRRLMIPEIALALAVLLTRAASASWQPGGNPVCAAPGAQRDPICVLPWIAWTDERHGPAQAYASWFEWHTGSSIAPSPADGFRVAPSEFPQSDIVADASPWDLSFYMAWSEDRGAGSGADIYLMRCVQGAPDPAWPAGGVCVCGASGDQVAPRLAIDHAHVFVSWEDSRSGDPDLYAADVLESAVLAPGWPADGLALDTGDDAVSNGGLAPLEDPNTFALSLAAFWLRGGRVVAQVVGADGILPAGWPPAGRTFSDATFPARGLVVRREEFSFVGEGAGALAAWIEDRDTLQLIRSQGIRGNGNLYATTTLDAVVDSLARPVKLWLPGTAYGQSLLVWQDVRADGGDLHRVSLSPPGNGIGKPFERAGPPEGWPLVTRAGVQQSSAWGFFYEDQGGDVPQVWSTHSTFYPLTGERMAPSTWAETQPSASTTLGGYVPEDPPYPVVVWTDLRDPVTGPDLYAQVLGRAGPGTVGVETPAARDASLSRPEPTPARRAVAFALSLPVATDVRLSILDVGGRRVRTLERATLPAGVRRLTWDARDERGARVSPGVYWVCATLGSQTLSRRLVLLGE